MLDQQLTSYPMEVKVGIAGVGESIEIDIVEGARLLREHVGTMEVDSHTFDIARSLTGLTLFVNEPDNECAIAVVDLRPVLLRMAGMLREERKRQVDGEGA